jgi:hypothetical protein
MGKEKEGRKKIIVWSIRLNIQKFPESLEESYDDDQGGTCGNHL